MLFLRYFVVALVTSYFGRFGAVNRSGRKASDGFGGGEGNDSAAYRSIRQSPAGPRDMPLTILEKPNPRPQKTPQDLTVFMCKGQVITHGLRGLKQRIIIPYDHVWNSNLAGPCLSGERPVSGAKRSENHLTVTTWSTANYSLRDFYSY
jgi:hypothetical protein